MTHSHLGTGGLTLLLAGLLLPQIDFSIINVALADLSRTLGVDEQGLALINAVYGLAFALTLAMAGRLGDNIGRRRLFAAGVGLFGLASLGCGLAGSLQQLLVARTLQGVGAALLVPQILATLHVCLSGRRHARALGYYSAVGGISFIVGQMLGGWLVSHAPAGLGWRSVFLINLPVCLVILAACRRLVPETRSARPVTLDLQGTLLLALTLSCLLVPLSPGAGALPAWCGPLVIPAALGLALWLGRSEIRLERAGGMPLLPPSLLALGKLRFGLLIALLFFTGWSGFMFVTALTLQTGAGMRPVDCGNVFIPLGLAYFVSALGSTRLNARVGAPRALLAGLTVQMAGLVLAAWRLQASWPHPDLWTLAPSFCLIGAGQAQIVSAFFRIGMADVPALQAGAASAVLSTVHQASLGLGSAVLGAVYARVLAWPGADRLLALEACVLTDLGLMVLLAGCALARERRQVTHMTTADRPAGPPPICRDAG